MDKEIKICFVCTGNTCRSVMAERILKKKIKTEKIQHLSVSSKGLRAKGENITENAKLVLKEISCSCVNRKSVLLKKIDKKTLYVAMTDDIKNQIDGKVISMKDLIGQNVFDPFGQDVEIYRLTREQILKGINVLLYKILNIRREK